MVNRMKSTSDAGSKLNGSADLGLAGRKMCLLMSITELMTF